MTLKKKHDMIYCKLIRNLLVGGKKGEREKQGKFFLEKKEEKKKEEKNFQEKKRKIKKRKFRKIFLGKNREKRLFFEISSKIA